MELLTHALLYIAQRVFAFTALGLILALYAVAVVCVVLMVTTFMVDLFPLTSELFLDHCTMTREMSAYYRNKNLLLVERLATLNSVEVQ
jgi:hypothetical protein